MASNTKLWIKVDLPFCDKVDKYSKMFSIQFIEYGRFMRDIFDSFKTDSDLNLFRLSLYNKIKTKVKIDVVNVSEDIGGDVITRTGFKLSSDIIPISNDILYYCLPKYITKDYFFFDSAFNHYYPLCDLKYHLY